MTFTPVPYGVSKPQAAQTVGTTAVQLPNLSAREVWITIDDANTGKIFFGDSTVTSTGGGKVAMKLPPGGVAVVQLTNMNLLYAVGTASGQVYYLWGQDA